MKAQEENKVQRWICIRCLKIYHSYEEAEECCSTKKEEKQ